MQLPPKRFQYDGDPKYDPIRWHPWFATLAERRKKIPMLEQAAMMVQQEDTVGEACAAMGVDERELRDFMDFLSGRSRLAELPAATGRAYQMLLDQAYDAYRDNGAIRNLTDVIYEQSPILGVNPRHVVELWAVDPTFYPTQYRGLK